MKMRTLLILTLTIFVLAACSGPTGTEPEAALNNSATPEKVLSTAAAVQEPATKPPTASAPASPTAVETVSDTATRAEAATSEAATGGAATAGEAVTPVEVDLSQITPGPVGDGTPREMPQPGVPNPQIYAQQRASEDLARRLGIDISAVTLVSVKAVDWPDGSLGCPAPGMAYTQAIVPGYQFILAAQGQQYTYHTNRAGSQTILCGPDGAPVPANN
jgi:hypothetical protein